MSFHLTGPRFDSLWRDLLSALCLSGKPVVSRGFEHREIINVTLELEDARNIIMVDVDRNLSYRFMFAEWLWIYFGRNDLATIAQYNKHMAEYSDDGVTLDGAYGIPVREHWGYVLNALRDDNGTRQAVIPIYRRSARTRTKDVPCTLSLQFMIRDGELHTTANMRSSDVWLGLPYDAFTFSMLGTIIATELEVRTGSLTLNLGSSHLYHHNRDVALRIAQREPSYEAAYTLRVPPQYFGPPPSMLEAVLTSRDPAWFVSKKQTFWSMVAQVLCAKTNTEAHAILHSALMRSIA